MRGVGARAANMEFIPKREINNWQLVQVFNQRPYFIQDDSAIFKVSTTQHVTKFQALIQPLCQFSHEFFAFASTNDVCGREAIMRIQSRVHAAPDDFRSQSP